MGQYNDIINLSRPKSNRPSMSLIDRAAQFGSFQALTGHSEDVIDENLKAIARCEMEIDKIIEPEISDIDRVDDNYIDTLDC